MSEGNEKVDQIIAPLDKHIIDGSEHFNPIYEAFWRLINKQEAVLEIVKHSEKDNKSCDCTHCQIRKLIGD